MSPADIKTNLAPDFVVKFSLHPHLISSDDAVAHLKQSFTVQERSTRQPVAGTWERPAALSLRFAASQLANDTDYLLVLDPDKAPKVETYKDRVLVRTGSLPRLVKALLQRSGQGAPLDQVVLSFSEAVDVTKGASLTTLKSGGSSLPLALVGSPSGGTALGYTMQVTTGAIDATKETQVQIAPGALSASGAVGIDGEYDGQQSTHPLELVFPAGITEWRPSVTF
jgi:hypothetical protein